MAFKATYADGGFEVFEAKDIFEAAVRLKRKYKHFFRMPIKIEEVR